MEDGQSDQPSRDLSQGLTARAIGERLGVSQQMVLKQWDALGPLFANWCRSGRSARRVRKRADPDGLGWVRGLDGRFYPVSPHQ
ncbi:hypothetical protein [Gloeobacter morelensis]|uniref:Uncharacterized protein n=1 Tax=Gloeobacter morelensis MG652769 TaxID=2781736 RepID=A0ABY3PSA6_9CYAN|nr:hypothetical protein [Gloeobacter morelensis]UFP96352.1 hypothetical protein ISF26_09135 [Gloeobacter morelensis MG652769]